MVTAMNTAANRSDWVGRVIDGRYPLLEWLGGSGGSDVFLTELEGDPPQKAAIKLIPADFGDANARMADWAATTPLFHPHLVLVSHKGRYEEGTERLLYVVTEYAEEVLSQILPERPLTPDEAREMLGPVLDALSFLHGKGFVHGHLKPSNILVIKDELKLSGDCLLVAGEPEKHFRALTVYDAPERTKSAISPAVDLWSLGVTLVEALTQHPPVWDRSATEGPVAPESTPEPFADIARECLKPDPAKRCTLDEVKTLLNPALSLAAPEDEPYIRPISKWRVTALVGVVLILILAVAAWILGSHHTQQDAGEQRAPAISGGQPQSPGSGTQSDSGAAAKGAVATQVLPDVSQGASESIHGQFNVKVRVKVDESGNVANATFDSQGPSRYFARAALEAAQQWKFKPAQVNGQAAASVWILKFQFRRAGTDVTPVEASP